MLALKSPTDVCAASQLGDPCECPCCKGTFILGGGVFAEVWFQGNDGPFVRTIAFCDLECVLMMANPQGRC